MKSHIIIIDDERDQTENKILELDFSRPYENILVSSDKSNLVSNDERTAMQELDFKETLKKNFYLTDDEGRRRVCQRFYTLSHGQNTFVILDKDIDFIQNL